MATGTQLLDSYKPTDDGIVAVGLIPGEDPPEATLNGDRVWQSDSAMRPAKQ
jgi:hypothetical protein